MRGLYYISFCVKIGIMGVLSVYLMQRDRKNKNSSISKENDRNKSLSVLNKGI